MIQQSLLAVAMNNISNMRGWPARQINPQHFVMEIVLPSRRTQVVNAVIGTDADNVQMVFFWSNVCPINYCPDPWMLLQESVKLSYGCYAVKDGNVIVKTSRVAQYLDTEELARVLFYVGANADELEARLVGAHIDQN